MKSTNSYLSAVALACVTLIVGSCASVTVRSTSGPKGGHGPPPHAPAHGYRHKHHGAELVYDSGRGVYVVVGLPDHYYFKGHYYRFGKAGWEVGVQIEGQWEAVCEESLPPGLRGKGKGKAKGKSKEHPGRGYGTQKKEW